VKINVYPEMHEAVTACTKLLATIAHYSDGGEEQAHKCVKSDMNWELIQDTKDLPDLWQKMEEKAMAKKQKTVGGDTQMTDSNVGAEGVSTDMGTNEALTNSTTANEKTRKVQDQMVQYLTAEHSRLATENPEEEWSPPKDRSELGKAHILPKNQQDHPRWKRRCYNREGMAVLMYNEGNLQTWEEVMRGKGLETEEEQVNIHPEVKRILVPYVRTLQEYRDVYVPALPVHVDLDKEWHDEESGMEEEDLNTQEYTWPRTVGFLLEELSVLASEMLKVSGSVWKKVGGGGSTSTCHRKY